MKIKQILIKSLLTSKIFREHLFKFFRSSIFSSQYIDVIVKVSGDNESIFYSLGKLTTLDLNNMSEKVKYVDHVIEKFNNLADEYESKKTINNKIYIYYKETDGIGYRKHLRNVNLSTKYKIDMDEGILPISNIPFNTNYKGWGTVSIENTSIFEVKDLNFDESILSIMVEVKNYNLAELTVKYKDGKNTLVLSDLKTKKDKIKRSYSSGEVVYFDANNPFFIFNDNIQKPVYKLDKKGRPTSERVDIIKPFEGELDENGHEKDENPVLKIVTLDIETYSDNGLFKILAICFGDGKSMNQYYISKYKSVDKLLDAVFSKLFTKEYDSSMVYIHNGANFDLIFLVKYLLSRNDIFIEPVYKGGKFISLTIKYGKDGKGGFNYVLTIRDSMLLLLTSLAKLGKSFGVEIQKDIFPYNFPTKENLNYKGSVPAYQYFDSKKVSLTEYNEYVNRFKDKVWSLEKETLNYCSKDCISLFQILVKFINLIYDKFGVNALKCPTLPSLAFRIFRLNFLLPTINIPLLKREIYDNLVQAYYGGHVDMYIPKGPTGVSLTDIKLLDVPKLLISKGIDYIKNMFKTIKHYDINSLYPSAMMDFYYPTDIIGYFIGDITLIKEYKDLYLNNIGIYKVKVNAPDIKHPLLPVRIDNTCIYPYGNWTGWYFGAEIKNAEKFGYKFEILGEYIFESKNIFTLFVASLNQIKVSSERGSAMYLIAKIILNSLYGRFGLYPFLDKHMFVPKKDYEAFLSENRGNVKDLVDLKTHYLVSCTKKAKSKDKDDRG